MLILKNAYYIVKDKYKLSRLYMCKQNYTYAGLFNY